MDLRLYKNHSVTNGEIDEVKDVIPNIIILTSPCRIILKAYRTVLPDIVVLSYSELTVLLKPGYR